MAVKMKTGVSARQNVGSQGPYLLTKYFKFNMTDQVTAQTTGSTSPTVGGLMGVLPAYAVPLECYVQVITAFTSGDLRVGTTSDLGAVVSTQDLASGTTGVYVVDRFMGTVSTTDVPLYCTTATTGAGAGEANIWLHYLPNLTPTTY